jgi:hypothetical protein
MKKSIAAAGLALAWATTLFGQGTVIFNNRLVGSVLTRVYIDEVDYQLIGNGTDEYSSTTMTPGTMNWSKFVPLSGSGWYAQLLAAPGANQPEYSLQPATPASTFRTGLGAGFVNGTTATLYNVPPDAPVATIEMVAWDNSSGLYPDWSVAGPAYRNGLLLAGEGGTFNLYNIGGLITPAPALYGLQSFNIPNPEPSTASLIALACLLFAFHRCR